MKATSIGENIDTVNVSDDQPEIFFGPEVDAKIQEGDVPPFYFSLTIHDKILHNVMLDSHNLISKVIMEKLVLDITRRYKYLYSYDSSEVKCLGIIKYLCIKLVKIPAKSVLMDIVVVDIPPKNGMFLSHSWGDKL